MLLYLETDLDNAYRLDCKARTKANEPWITREQFRSLYEDLITLHLEKAEQVYTKAVLDLGKVVGKQDQKAGREVVGLYRTLSASMKKFKELLSREILDKIQ